MFQGKKCTNHMCTHVQSKKESVTLTMILVLWYAASQGSTLIQYPSCLVLPEQRFGMLWWPHRKRVSCSTQPGHCSSAKEIYSHNFCNVLCFTKRKAAQPGKCLHLFLHTWWLVTKHLVATSNVTITSQKVVSKHIARIPVQGTITAIFAVNMCQERSPTS